MLLIATIDPILRKNLQQTLTEKGDPFLLLDEGENIIETVLRHNPSLVVVDLYLTQPSGLEIYVNSAKKDSQERWWYWGGNLTKASLKKPVDWVQFKLSDVLSTPTRSWAQFESPVATWIKWLNKLPSPSKEV